MYPTLPYLPVIVKEISVHGAYSSLPGEFDAMLEFFFDTALQQCKTTD
jgi:hypothetical protein